MQFMYPDKFSYFIINYSKLIEGVFIRQVNILIFNSNGYETYNASCYGCHLRNSYGVPNSHIQPALARGSSDSDHKRGGEQEDKKKADRQETSAESSLDNNNNDNHNQGIRQDLVRRLQQIFLKHRLHFLIALMVLLE